jgi:hypothetical protein
MNTILQLLIPIPLAVAFGFFCVWIADKVAGDL